MIKSALSWRFQLLRQHFQKFKWSLRQFLDFSPKAEIDAISIIVVGRNDNYGGDFSFRLKTVLDWNLTHLPNAELIYIEWNQIKERPSDCDWISKRYLNSYCYIVSNEIHKKITDNPKMPMMEYFAKNIGIRKSQSNWVLMINADVFIGSDTLKNLHRLNVDTVYGTHYISIKWDGEPLNESHQKDKKIRVAQFTAPYNLSATVGNFIFTHKKNWLKATGYDERLYNVRAGVDSNGLLQLLYSGLKTQVLGSHFHLDHPESIIHGTNDSHGNHLFDNIPYQNPDDWGMANYPLKKISERIWELQVI